ncbi:MAG TPA: DUF4232 domain-containing protein [Gaiellaceae bacterium]|nr:DUF4232 domain-containing protein [Gaiellaceae bacterium]
MAGRRAAAGLALSTLALTAAGCGLGGSTKTVTVTRTETETTTTTVTTTASVANAKPCAGTDVAAVFTLIPGSAGAGQISYTLTVKNSSQIPCSLHGIPQGTLLGATGTALPTHVKSSGGGGRRVVLPPGASATAQARFSPDVAGTGDSQSGTCQPVAHAFQLNAAGGVTEATIKPPTSVCQQGTLNFEAFDYAG